MRWIGWGVVIACGCGRIGLDATTMRDAIGSADATGDATGSSDAPPNTCPTLTPNDNFAPGGAPCGTWGGPTLRGFTMARGTSGLVITPTTFISNADFGGCTVSNYDETQGIFVDVTSVAAQSGGYTNLVAYVTTSSPFGMQVDAAGLLHLTTGSAAGVSYDPVAMRFWRIIPSGTFLVAQYAPDGQAWTELASMDMGVSDFSAIANVTFGAGRISATGAGTATFAAFNRCP